MNRTYSVETMGCQMNAHDSERIAGLLESSGLTQARDNQIADVIVFNTCAVRENADNKLYGRLSFLAPIKKKNPQIQIAVGGCLAQKDQSLIMKKAPYVDVVFGTHNVGSLPQLLEKARNEGNSHIEILEELENFPSIFPAKRSSEISSWVAISVGCNNTCTFCIVPTLRGLEKDREPEDILAEVRSLVAAGVVEVMLLGQNVNAYQNGGFANLLDKVAKVDGLQRIRFMSPHPRDFTDDVIEVMARHENIAPHLHMPLQSGSDRILKEMRRSYRSDRFLKILEKVRIAIPNAQITTDIIVGFPGENEADFQATLDLCTVARFSAAYTYKYSIRPGTPAGEMKNQIDEEIVRERYTRLHEHQNLISLSVNQESIGEVHRVLVSDSEGRRDSREDRLSGRSGDYRLVHFPYAHGIKAGDFIDVKITSASAHYLLGDVVELISSRPRSQGLLLGMPSIK